MNRILLSVLVACFSHFIQAQNIVHYKMSFPNAVHHEAEIEIHLESTTPGKPLTLVMSKSSPGRYAYHQFGKNVYNVRVSGDGGAMRLAERIEPDSWKIVPKGKTVKIQYTLFANHADGTYSDIDEDHAHLNMPATFAWIKELQKAPIDIEFIIPDRKQWKIATQLKETTQANRFSAPNLYYFLDSPTKLGNLDIREWTYKDANIRMAVLHDGPEEAVTKLFDMTKKIVQEQTAVYGELPNFDFGEYTFLCDYRNQTSGDAMEHRNSTVCTSSHHLHNNQHRHIGSISHEFFHIWNVERMRPKSLEPFNFEDINMSGELWFAEGFTNYYDELTLVRSGIITEKEYFKNVSGTLNYVANAPGTKLYSAVEMSKHAPFVDAATSVDPANFANMFTSYYSYGEVIGLALDLTLRSSFNDVDLDDYMRDLWIRFGRTEKPFTNDDLEDQLALTTEDEKFAKDFFDRYIYSPNLADYNHLLSHAGYHIPKNNDVMLGFFPLRFKQKSIELHYTPRMGSPVYRAGMHKGDKIVMINGKPLKSKKKWNELKSSLNPGDVVQITYLRNGKTKTASTELQANNKINIKKLSNLTDSQLEFKRKWLSTKVKNQ